MTVGDTGRLDSTLNQIARYAAAIAEQVRADEATEDTAVLADAIESLACTTVIEAVRP